MPSVDGVINIFLFVSMTSMRLGKMFVDEIELVICI